MKPGSEAWLRARGVAWVHWSPGEPEDDLHGFVTQRERDEYERGKPGPFRRVVRDHHKLGPVPDDVRAAREITDKWQTTRR